MEQIKAQLPLWRRIYKSFKRHKRHRTEEDALTQALKKSGYEEKDYDPEYFKALLWFILNIIFPWMEKQDNTHSENT